MLNESIQAMNCKDYKNILLITETINLCAAHAGYGGLITDAHILPEHTSLSTFTRQFSFHDTSLYASVMLHFYSSLQISFVFLPLYYIYICVCLIIHPISPSFFGFYLSLRAGPVCPSVNNYPSLFSSHLSVIFTMS